MYTIKQASIRTGISVPLLRAWERRYGIPSPARTASGYRLYDEAALARVRQMRALVSQGWAPSQAATAVLEGQPAAAAADLAIPAGEPLRAAASVRDADVLVPGARDALVRGGALVAGDTLVRGDARVARDPGANKPGPLSTESFVAAAANLDDAALDESLAEAFATLGPDEALTRFALPALVAVGEAWAAGTLDVSGEHAASAAVLRRLGALYEAAGEPATEADVIIGLPPRGRHEIGALAFAVACRRSGMRVLYLGADVPLDSWRAAVRAQPQAAVVLGAVTREEARSASDVVRALRAERPGIVVAVGGASGADITGAIVLPPVLRSAVGVLREQLAR